MGFSEIIVITEKGKFKAQVDLEADGEAILEGLVAKTELPLRDERGSNIEYRLAVLDATTLRPGGTVRIERIEPPAVGDVIPL